MTVKQLHLVTARFAFRRSVIYRYAICKQAVEPAIVFSSVGSGGRDTVVAACNIASSGMSGLSLRSPAFNLGRRTTSS